MNFLFGTFAIIGTLFMVTFMFIGIWLFIVALKAFRQLRYKNYILEKIYQKLDILINNNNTTSTTDSEDIVTKDFFDLENDHSKVNYDNVKDFEQHTK